MFLHFNVRSMEWWQNDRTLVKELLTTTENQRYIRFMKQERYKLRYLAAKTEGKGREMGMQ